MKGKTVLLTGGTGTFGHAFAREALTLNPHSIRIFSRGEHRQAEMEAEFNDSRLRFFIGDVRDRNRLHRAMQGVDMVVHAAAQKRVPTSEYNPVECVATNVQGTVNVVEEAVDAGVGKCVLISSDKSVQATNLYGATKRVAEGIFVQGNVYSARTRFACVRYGNVLGSQGSVMDLWRGQKNIQFTDPRMTRFWLTARMGVNLVLYALEHMSGGEIYVPKVKSMKMIDFADVVAPLSCKTIIGIRPGEKLHETLITEDEGRHTLDLGPCYCICPEFPYWTEGRVAGKRVPDGFRYASDTALTLTALELEKMMEEV